MLPDTRILTRHRDYSVLRECQGIVFRDESTLQLHAVRKFDIDEMFIRALRIGDHWFVIDLRATKKSFAIDIAQAPPRDVSGVVLYTLREAFESSIDFYQRVLENHLDIWLADLEMPESQMVIEFGEVMPLTSAEANGVRQLMKRPGGFRMPYGRSAA